MEQHSFHYRPAVEADIVAIERLVLHNFPHLMHALMGSRPDYIKHKVLIGLRQTRLHPIANVFVATNEAEKPIGVVAYDTRDSVTGFNKGRLAALKPLGIMGMLRFLLMARYAFYKYMPVDEDVYMRTLAIDRTYRRQGVGCQLWQYAENAAQSTGYRKATVLIASKNKAALSLAEQMNYRLCGEYKTYWRGRIIDEPSLTYLEKEF